MERKVNELDNIVSSKKPVIWIPDAHNVSVDWITDDIAVGMQPANNAQVGKLVDEGATNFLCLHRRKISYQPEDFGINFKHIKIADNKLMYLNDAIEGIDFIHDAIQNNEKVFVHCEVGISRSPMMVMLYFIIYEQLNFTEAMAKVAKHRCVINPDRSLLGLDLIIDLMNHYSIVSSSQ